MSTAAPVRRRALQKTWWLIAPALILLIGFLILPYVSIMMMSLREASSSAVYGDGYTIAHYRDIVGDSFVWGIVGRSLQMGLTVTVVTLLLGYPVAYHLARSRSRWTSLLYICVISPLLGNLQAISPDLAMVGRSLGASRLRTFFKVTLPLSMPGIQAGTILVFVLSISAYVTPAMQGGTKGRTMSVLVVQYLVDNFRWPAGAALAIFMSAITLGIVFVSLRLTAHAMRRMP